MSLSLIFTEHPEVPAAEIPAMFHGPDWRDESYRNDMCPRFAHVSGKLEVFVDRLAPEDREDPSFLRFGVYCLEDTGASITDFAAFECETEFALLGHLIDMGL